MLLALQLVLPVPVRRIIVLCEIFKVKVTAYSHSAIAAPGWLRNYTGGGIEVEDIDDDKLVVELEKKGFIDRIYK